MFEYSKKRKTLGIHVSELGVKVIAPEGKIHLTSTKSWQKKSKHMKIS